MIRTYLAAAAALLLAACGQSTAPTTEEAPAAPQGLLEQIQAEGPEQQTVLAYQAFTAYQTAHPEAVVPPCTAVRGTDRITVPENVAADSIYAPLHGQVVFTVQCGALISATRMDFNEKWLVSFAPGASEATVQHCQGERGLDLCPRTVPTAAAAPTP
ncbi:MAG: hypothetical protein NT015_09730 [Alphaproteobacteria bacterium]|nr:hypothetical protein [Alphaproteobacteria bacterium]